MQASNLRNNRLYSLQEREAIKKRKKDQYNGSEEIGYV